MAVWRETDVKITKEKKRETKQTNKQDVKCKFTFG